MEPKKIIVESISDFKSGELLTEEKLNRLFKYIGDTINSNSEVVKELKETIASFNFVSRWLGQVKTFKDIEVWIQNNKSKFDTLPKKVM